MSSVFSAMAASLPSAPSTPTRKESSENSISIEWTAPSDDGGTPIFDYQVLWDQGTGGSFVSLGSSSNSLDFTPPYELITGQTYRFKVRAINYIGAGSDSEAVSIISATGPDIPTAPYLYSATHNQIEITWDPVYNGGSPILGYNIKMAAVGSSSQPGMNVTTEVYDDVTSTGVLDVGLRRFTTPSNLVTGTHYKFTIQAYNGVEDSGWSENSNRIITALVPSQPLHLAKSDSTKTSISIEWEAPTSDGGATVNGYRVYSDQGAGNDVFTFIGETTEIAYVHINLAPPGITLTYKVSAFNDIGEGELSESVSIILGTVPATPAAPTLIESTQTTIEVEWIAPDNGGTAITNYFVQINSGSGNTYVTVGDTAATSFVVEGLTTG